VLYFTRYDYFSRQLLSEASQINLGGKWYTIEKVETQDYLNQIVTVNVISRIYLTEKYEVPTNGASALDMLLRKTEECASGYVHQNTGL